MQERQVLLQKIVDNYRAANQAVSDLQRCIWNSNDESEPDELKDDAEESIQRLVRSMFFDLRILAETLKLPQTRQEISETEAKHKDLAAIEEISVEGDIYVPALAEAASYMRSLQALVDPQNTSEVAVFRTILQHTAKIIKNSSLIPSKEVEVRNRIWEITTYSFTDAVREVPMPHSVKTYKGDIGVPSIKAMAEYKFAKTATEMKNCLDGVYADMRGYSGHFQWRHFFAVFYMREPFFTQDHIEKEFKNVGANANWIPIVVNGEAV